MGLQFDREYANKALRSTQKKKKKLHFGFP